MATQAVAGSGKPAQSAPVASNGAQASSPPGRFERHGASPQRPAGPSLLTLERLREQYELAQMRLHIHERRYPPINRACVNLLKLDRQSAGIRDNYREQDGLRRALLAAEQLYREQSAHLPSGVREKIWRGDGAQSGSSAKSDVRSEADRQESEPSYIGGGLTYLPHEQAIAHVNNTQQERYLADYLRLPHAAPHSEAPSSTLSLCTAESAPRFVPPPISFDADIFSTPAPSAASQKPTNEAGSSSAAGTSSADSVAEQLAHNLVLMRDQQALSPRDTRGLNFAIAERAAADRAQSALVAAKSRLVALDVPQEVAAVFGSDPVDYFALPMASHAWYDACLDPRKQRPDFADVVREGRGPQVVEPVFHVLRWEDHSKQKHVFVRFHDHGTKRQGLLTLQQFVQTTAGPQPDTSNSHSAWRVLDPYRFRNAQLRHFPDAIHIGASRKLNQLSLKREVRELLLAVGELVHRGSHQETTGAQRLLILGPPQRPTAVADAASHEAASGAASGSPPIDIDAPPKVAPAPRNAISAQTLVELPLLTTVDAPPGALAQDFDDGSDDRPRGRSPEASVRPRGDANSRRSRARQFSPSLGSVSPSPSPRRSTDAELLFAMSPIGSPAGGSRPSSRNALATGPVSRPAPTEALRPRPTAPVTGARKPAAAPAQPLKSAMRKPGAPATTVRPAPPALFPSKTQGHAAEHVKRVRHATHAEVRPVDGPTVRIKQPELQRQPAGGGGMAPRPATPTAKRPPLAVARRPQRP